MADQDLLPGNRFRLYRKAAGDTDFKFVCLATTITFTRTANMESAVVADCDNPTGIPHERSYKSYLSWAINFSGKTDPLRLQAIETDYEAEDPSQYQLVADRAAAKGGQTYTGNMHIAQLELGRPENGLITFSAQGRGDGVLDREQAAA